MATTYVSMSNLTKYDALLKQYIADGWYDKSEIDAFLAAIAETESTFITKSVNDLVNYYTKSETYTKTEVNSLISTIPMFSIVVVNELPTEDISTTTIYLLRNSSSEEHNLFTEYIYVNNAWEILGTQSIDLSDYYTIEEIDYLLPKYLSDLTDDIGNITTTNISDYGVTGIRGESEQVYQKGNLTLNKRMVGLSLVENKSPRQIIAQMTGEDVTSALGFMPLDELGYVQNSSTQNGYVTASNGAGNKVWGTDSNGVPGWQNAASGGGVTGVKGDSESTYRTGNVNLTKANIGLSNVENKSSATIRSEITKSDIVALGIASDDVVSKQANGLVPQLPNETATTKYLRQDGTWAEPSGGGASSMSQLTDVSLSSLANGDVLVYNSTSSLWENSTDLKDLADAVGEVNAAFDSLFTPSSV